MKKRNKILIIGLIIILIIMATIVIAKPSAEKIKKNKDWFKEKFKKHFNNRTVDDIEYIRDEKVKILKVTTTDNQEIRVITNAYQLEKTNATKK